MAVYSWAKQTRRYDSAYPSSGYTGGPRKGLLHTTETGVVPSYGGGASAPHFTAIADLSAKTLTWYQHYDTDRPSRALRNLSGGVQTNNDGVLQIELVGTTVKSYRDKYGYLYWEDAPDWLLKALAEKLVILSKDHGIAGPLLPGSKWLSNGAGYGATSVRMSQAEWDAFDGWSGHMHCPENTHSDPGGIDADKINSYMEGDDMSTEDVNKIIAASRTTGLGTMIVGPGRIYLVGPGHFRWLSGDEYQVLRGLGVAVVGSKLTTEQIEHLASALGADMNNIRGGSVGDELAEDIVKELTDEVREAAAESAAETVAAALEKLGGVPEVDEEALASALAEELLKRVLDDDEE